MGQGLTSFITDFDMFSSLKFSFFFYSENKLKLIIIGSCRNKEDEERKKNMEDLSRHLSLENSVEIKANVSYQELIQNYKMASIGIHTMWNEHFGISVVELMAAGLITVAHRLETYFVKFFQNKSNSDNISFF